MIELRIRERIIVTAAAIVAAFLFASFVASFITEAGNDLAGRLTAIQEATK